LFEMQKGNKKSVNNNNRGASGSKKGEGEEGNEVKSGETGTSQPSGAVIINARFHRLPKCKGACRLFGKGSKMKIERR